MILSLSWRAWLGVTHVEGVFCVCGSAKPVPSIWAKIACVCRNGLYKDVPNQIVHITSLLDRKTLLAAQMCQALQSVTGPLSVSLIAGIQCTKLGPDTALQYCNVSENQPKCGSHLFERKLTCCRPRENRLPQTCDPIPRWTSAASLDERVGEQQHQGNHQSVNPGLKQTLCFQTTSDPSHFRTKSANKNVQNTTEARQRLHEGQGEQQHASQVVGHLRVSTKPTTIRRLSRVNFARRLT